MSASPFPKLSAYGNYDAAQKLPRGIYQIKLDGTIRIVRKLGIAHVEVITIDEVGKHWYPRCVGYAIRNRDRKRLERALEKAKEKRSTARPSPHPDLLLCVQEASRAAHRERDAAEEAYGDRRHDHAGKHRKRKETWYQLKERGITAAHKQGMLRYAGASPQGMAVYEYGDGGMQCFHSTLHPVGMGRTAVPDHPETLLVEAKHKVRGVSLLRVEVTLSSLPNDASGYERSAPPRVAKSLPTCWECGEEGHIARHCPDRDDGADYYSSYSESESAF